MNCPSDNTEMEKWESWGDYIQYRCPLCGFESDNKAELEKTRVKPKKDFCPHFGMVMELGNCFFCHFKSQQKREKFLRDDTDVHVTSKTEYEVENK